MLKTTDAKIPLGAVTIDVKKQSVLFNERDLGLTDAEFELLWHLAQNQGNPVSRDNLFQKLMGMEWDGCNRAIDVRVVRLRKKFKCDESVKIRTIRGIGYTLFVDETANQVTS